MLIAGLVAAVPVLNDGVEEILEYGVSLLVARHRTHRHDERVAWGEGRGDSDVTARLERAAEAPAAERGKGMRGPQPARG